MDKVPGRLSRLTGKIPYLLMLLPVLVAALYVQRYGVNAPYNDGLTLIPLLEKFLAGELRFEDLAAQHNEHRIFFPRIAFILLGLATGFNDVATMYSILACLLVTSATLLLVFRRTASASLWLFVPVPFLIFNLGQSWNLLQGFQLTLIFVQTFSVLSFALLYLCGGERGRLAFFGALASGTVAAFSSAPGLLVWPLGLLQLLLTPAVRGARRGMLAAWGLAGALAWALYLRGYESAETTSWRDSLQHPLESAQYLVSALGASLFHGQQDLAFAGGLLMTFLVAVALLLAYARGRVAENSVWISMLAFALLTVAATSVARGANLEDALNPKYVSYTVLAPVAVYAMLLGALRGRRDSSPLISLVALGVLVAISLPLSYSQGIVEAQEIAEDKRRTAFVLATHESQPDEVLASRGVLRERFRVSPQTSREQASFLERRGYSIFSEARPKVLPPPLPDPSPDASNKPSSASVEGSVEASLVRAPSGDSRKSFVRVSGWAAEPGSEETVKGVYVLVDGRPYPAFYGARSTKAVERLGDPSYEYSGFERAIPLSELGPGGHELSVIAVTDTGETYVEVGEAGQRMRFEL